MRAGARSANYRCASSTGARDILQVRAGLSRTFGGLGSFLAVIFLGSGIYLLQESFTDPIRAQAVGLIAGAFIIALATILIYFIFSPGKKSQRREVHAMKMHRPSHAPAISLPANASPLLPTKENAKRLRNTVATVN